MKRFLSILLILACAAAVILYPRNEYLAGKEYTDVKSAEPIAFAEAAVPESTPAITAAPTETAPSATPTAAPSPTPTPQPTPTPAPTPRIVTVNALYEGVTDENGVRDVIRLQVRLNELGYLNGEMDGKFGAETASAVAYFQLVNGLETNGCADFSTQDMLYSRQALPCPGPTATPLVTGAKGDEVLKLQEFLVLYGFLGSEADGSFGAKTESAVILAKTYVHDLTLDYYEAHPTASPAPTLPWMTPTPTPVITPRVTKNLATGQMEEVTDFIPTPTPSVRPAPTPAPWTADGMGDDTLFEALSREDFATYRYDVRSGDRNDEVRRVQNRLTTLGYSRSADGVFGEKTERALKYFQLKNNLPQTGIADKRTQKRLCSNDAVKSDVVVTEYRITVSLSKQRTYVYKWNGEGFDAKPIKTFKCSTGLNDTPTPKGTFWNTGRIGGEWYYFKEFDCWAKYAWVIDGGVLFHSVIYSSKSNSSVRQGTIRALGKKASHGCVRLAVADAKWIYDNCSAGTPVTVE